MAQKNYDWESFFQKRIRERGYSYYLDGRVEQAEQDGGKLSAVVSGTEDYEVGILFDRDEILDMTCTCPYAVDGKYCKHMAAVLYWREEAQARKAAQASWSAAASSDPVAQDMDPVERMVFGAEENLVRRFLADILQEDEALQNRFHIAVGDVSITAQLRLYRDRMEEIIARNGGRDHFISWNQASDFEAEVERILYAEIGMMIEQGHYELARQLINQIFLKLSDVQIDDDGEMATLATACVEEWEELLRKAGTDVQEAQYRWVKEHLEEDRLDYLRDYLVEILFRAFHAPEQIREKRAIAEGELKAIAGGETRKFYFGSDFWTEKMIGLMVESGTAPEEIEAWCRGMLHEKKAREYLIAKYTLEKDYPKVLALLEEGIGCAAGKSCLQNEYRMQMLRIYQETGEEEAYRSLLRQMVTKYKPGDMDLFLEMKALVPPEEWETVRDGLFAEMPSHTAMGVLYSEEKLYDRLLKWVLECPDILMLDEYASELAPIYSKEILDAYEACLQKEAASAASRSKYRSWVSVLKHMRDFPGGRECVQRIAAGWRIQYKNRPAMMDELKKLDR